MDWDKKAKNLVGRKIVGARYLTDEECKEMGWYNKPIAILLDDESWIFPSMDDEGNDGGALFSTNDKYEFPVIS